jgi:hypothetical protein
MRCVAWLVICFGGLAIVAPVATGHGQTDPNLLLEIATVRPRVDGLVVRVLDRDRLDLHNGTGQTVVVFGVAGEPYVRVLANGPVEANLNSPTLYRNENQTPPPAVRATAPGAPPKWRFVAPTRRFFWHDRRALWLRRTRPPQVLDPRIPTRIFDWRIPIAVGGQRGQITGRLVWAPTVPDESSAPVALIVGGAAVLLLLVGGVLMVRRRYAARAFG